MRKMRRRSANSNSPMAAAITTAANALLGRSFKRLGAHTKRMATAMAPTTPMSYVFAPVLPAPGGREGRLLIGNRGKRRAPGLAAPGPPVVDFDSAVAWALRAYAAGKR